MIVDEAVVRAEDYIEIDNTLGTSDMLDDDEIPTAVQEAPENKGEDEIALESIQNLHNYLRQNSDIK